MITFEQMGFATAVTASSDTPEMDGYIGQFQGYPYHIHPSATPDAYIALVAAIASNEVTVVAYAAPVITLQQAQATLIASLTASYDAAAHSAVSFTTAAGVTKNFQADDDSRNELIAALTGYNIAQATPSGYYWKSEDNAEVPFALADLKGLYAAMLAQGWAAFQQLQVLKAQVSEATTVETVQAVVWP